MINNKYYAIDAHCHIYPDKIAKAAVSHTDAFYGIKSVYDGTLETLLNKGGQDGIDRFIVQSVATSPKQVGSINGFIAKSVAQNSGKLVGLGTLHPDSQTLRDDVDQIISLGLHGVKLHPDIQEFKTDDFRCLKIYELCEESGLPILMHTGDSRYDFSNPNRLIEILKIYSGLTVVGAHFGGWSVWDEAARKLTGIENFYVDCSSSLSFLGKERAKEIIRAYGTDRVLFATDYPMWGAKKEIDTLLDINLTDEDYQKIFSENALAVYNVN